MSVKLVLLGAVAFLAGCAATPFVPQVRPLDLTPVEIQGTFGPGIGKDRTLFCPSTYPTLNADQVPVCVGAQLVVVQAPPRECKLAVNAGLISVAKREDGNRNAIPVWVKWKVPPAGTARYEFDNTLDAIVLLKNNTLDPLQYGYGRRKPTSPFVELTITTVYSPTVVNLEFEYVLMVKRFYNHAWSDCKVDPRIVNRG